MSDPIVNSVSASPANDFNGMTSEVASRGVRVDSGSVGVEVPVDFEGSLNGALGLDLIHHVLDSSNLNSGATLALESLEGNG